MTDLSILIPSRNEQFLGRTIQDVLAHIEADTEVIAVLDGAWAEPQIEDDPRVTLIYHPVSIGQRAATNEAARYSQAKFIMKVDAHCAFDQGFDRKLMEDIEYDWTVVPRMYNLHVFDWTCKSCGERTYQGPKPAKCSKCNGGDFNMDVVWQPRRNRCSDFARFDNTLHFQYWGGFKSRPESQGDIADLMCHVGACWMMHRQRFWDLGGCDENHGSWGQMGVEISCKSWLSGGRQVVNKKTWFAHLFRTQPGFGFPYPNPGINKAREYSRQLWIENKWPKAVHPLSWLIEKFAPVPDWDVSKGILYYTDNRLDEKIMIACQKQLQKAAGERRIVSVSLNPIVFGDNVVLPLERGVLSMFKQILAGLEALDTDVVFFAEHDILYHTSHFEFVPPTKDAFYYNTNVWKVRLDDGHALSCTDTKQTSGLCAYRELLLEHYKKRIAKVEQNSKDLKVQGLPVKNDGYSRYMGFEPGCHSFPRGVDNYKAISWKSPQPNIDIRHGQNLTPSRWSKDKFRDQRYTEGWTEADEVPGWYEKDKFAELLTNIN